MAHIAFHESCNFIEDSFTGNENDLTHNVPGTENILLKTQFFSRIGIGRKTMQTIPIEHQRSMAAYIQKEDPHSENRYLKEDLQNLGNLQKSSKADIDFEMKEKENRSNNIDQGDKRKQPLSMKTKSQSLDILAMKSKDNNLESISQCAGNFEFAEEEVDENSAIEAELNVIEEGSSSDFFYKDGPANKNLLL